MHAADFRRANHQHKILINKAQKGCKMMNWNLLNASQRPNGVESPILRVVELMHFFSKDSAGVRVAVLSILLGAEIALRAFVISARLILLFTIVYASAVGLR